MDPNKILLIGDSRVRRLGEFAAYYRRELFYYCEVVSFSGKTLSYIVGELLEILKSTKFTYVIVLAGVNELTTKMNNHVQLRAGFVRKMPASLMSVIQFCCWSAEFISPQTKLIFCPEIGLCVAKYNEHLSNIDVRYKTYNNLDALQLLLIWKLKKHNENIVSFNDRASLPTPKFHRRVFHKYKSRGIRCAYSLLKDGIHQNDTLSNIMITSILDCIYSLP